MTINVESGFVDNYMNAVSTSFESFLPILGATIGIFLAFAIANSIRFIILKMVGSKNR